MELTNEEKKAKVRDFRPIDDVFFEVLAQNPKVCQEMLRTLLEDESLEVLSVITQSDEAGCIVHSWKWFSCECGGAALG